MTLDLRAGCQNREFPYTLCPASPDAITGLLTTVQRQRAGDSQHDTIHQSTDLIWISSAFPQIFLVQDLIQDFPLKVIFWSSIVWLLHLGFCFCFFFKRFYLFIQERQRERVRDTGRGRSRLPAGTPMWDSIPGPRRQMLNRWAPQGPCI